MRNKQGSTAIDIRQPRAESNAEVRTPLQFDGAKGTISSGRSTNNRRSSLRAGKRIGAGISHEHKPHERNDLLLLYRKQQTWERIEQAIEQKQWRYLALSSFPAMQDAFRLDVKVILVDATFLPEIERQPSWLHGTQQEPPTLFFVTDRCDVEIHIQALQAGATKLFSEPVDLTALIQATEEIIRPRNRPNFKVLIISDDELKAKPTIELLREGAMETLILSEPLSVIDTIWGFRPDLVLMLEPSSTGVDNIALTKLIRDREETMAIPIALLSDSDDPEKERQALLAGADDFLSRSSQPQTLLATVVNRIKRVKAISTTGIQIIEQQPTDLFGKQTMLTQLVEASNNFKDRGWSYGLVVIALGSTREAEAAEQDANLNQLVTLLAEGFRAILQTNDHMARIGGSRLAILFRRGERSEVKRQAELAIEIINYRLATYTMTAIKFGVGLVMIKKDTRSADELLKQGEQAADIAYRQWRKGYAHYIERPAPPGSEVKEGGAWLREEFEDALQSDAITMQERSFVCTSLSINKAEIIELTPQLDLQGTPVDIYQQAALNGAADEFDRYVCDCALQRLYDFTHQGKQVRFILRQSAAVLEKSGYIDFIKNILRRFHIVGNGLLLEFSLPAIASRLTQATRLFSELAALGIGVSLSHLPCNDSGVKALLHLKPEVVRPRSTHLYGKIKKMDIAKVVEEIHSLQAEIVLPRIEHRENVSPEWYQYADFIEADLLQYERPQLSLREASFTRDLYPGE